MRYRGFTSWLADAMTLLCLSTTLARNRAWSGPYPLPIPSADRASQTARWGAELSWRAAIVMASISRSVPALALQNLYTLLLSTLPATEQTLSPAKALCGGHRGDRRRDGAARLARRQGGKGSGGLAGVSVALATISGEAGAKLPATAVEVDSMAESTDRFRRGAV